MHPNQHIEHLSWVLTKAKLPPGPTFKLKW